MKGILDKEMYYILLNNFNKSHDNDSLFELLSYFKPYIINKAGNVGYLNTDDIEQEVYLMLLQGIRNEEDFSLSLRDVLNRIDYLILRSVHEDKKYFCLPITEDSAVVDMSSVEEEVFISDMRVLADDIFRVLRKNGFTDRNIDIVKRYYGFCTGKKESLKDVGLVYGVSGCRTRQVVMKALIKARHSLHREPIFKEMYEVLRH